MIPHGSGLLLDLAVVLAVAAATTVLCQRLRQPVVLGYLLAGVLIGHVLLPGPAQRETAAELAELGVILLMFSIGIEFNVRNLARVGVPAALTVMFEVGLLAWLGYLAADLLGWSATERLFVAAMLAISSTMLVGRSLDPTPTRSAADRAVFGVLVFEDLAAVLLLTMLTTVASGSGLSPVDVARTSLRLLGLLALVLGGGYLVVPRLIRLVARFGRPETLLITCTGLCFAMSVLVRDAGFSVALGAFLAGLLVAEAGVSEAVLPLVRPLEDLFAAIFFVAIGLSVDPQAILRNWIPILLFSSIVVLGKLMGVGVGSFLAGGGLPASVRAGLLLGQIGEFSFIIAGLGAASKAARPEILPIAVGVSVLTSFTAPLLLRASGRATALLDSGLPRGLQTFVTLYTVWMDRLRSERRRGSAWFRIRRATLVLLGSAVLLAGSVIAGTVLIDPMVQGLQSRGMPALRASALVATLAGALWIACFLLIVRQSLAVGRLLAAEVLPVSGDGVDFGLAPRRSFVLALVLGITLLVGLPLLAILVPFIPPARSALILLFWVVAVGLAFWRSLTAFEGHLHATALAIVEALSATGGEGQAPSLARLGEVMPEAGHVRAVRIPVGSPIAGMTLARINLRAVTGATVLAVERRGAGRALPRATEQLDVGDVLALTGSEEAVSSAVALIAGDGRTNELR